uniref:homogentisate 1,2-dioxygenase n=1 Tax=Chromera velia CCMP2878 TaxID=1169474 RepID=A0A0G4GC87_9ALVE|mmetsp:Transcript_11012/g.21272  ORF Transcript_11012/g.21272 Transcript_11012/m.21272 type:complete len:457 (-) Transcript_11012:186-1556(-)|eukprot:Cvel_21189.t1-p1 / transcript=Cvel_21189.t1 / gene=Cvel_21189 / organism=Chromera_velia_CCMP2878 / gene_product=Homogentisate 1,2-dioxygenase, putative / transcript_product=Homogentisate 1,2-dioxygenase, putative / location=Cvel_scaffold1967:4165-5613(-) / protein_length=456 / sequence_SO=supercontig / SO=protein_coding / is_pseudo=false
MKGLKYMPGFGNMFSTEALVKALPKGQNSPQKPPYGLYAEQLSGTAFTAPRVRNQFVWMYRVRPSVSHTPFSLRMLPSSLFVTPPFSHSCTPEQLRWSPPDFPSPDKRTNFLEGLMTMAANGSPQGGTGGACLMYTANENMTTSRVIFTNADAHMLLIPQTGRLHVKTELGVMEVSPLEIGFVPKGMKFQVDLPDGPSRGYACENYGQNFVIPDLGPIGSSSGLANPRHFLTPEASFEETADGDGPFRLVNKFLGNLWEGEVRHSPLDVVAWYGNYVPWKYDLRLFTCINSVTHDHPDPSIYTVVTSPSVNPGTANIDFVIFPPRWVTMENTFRPPWFHRNVMSEFMGLIHGSYDAKPGGGGFSPGGASLHNSMSAHGPDAAAFDAASSEDTTTPKRYRDTMAFMLESSLVWEPSKTLLETPLRQQAYVSHSWGGLKSHFDASQPGENPEFPFKFA